MNGKNALDDAREGRRVAVIGRTLFEARDALSRIVDGETDLHVTLRAGLERVQVVGGGSIRFFSVHSTDAIRGHSFDSLYATSMSVAARIVRDPSIPHVLAASQIPRFGILT